MADGIKSLRTPYGFQFGAAKIECIFSDDKKHTATFGLYTPKHDMIQIYVTKTGKVRIHDNNGEWTPQKKKLKCTH